MRAMVLRRPNEPLEMCDIPAPVPRAGEVLVRVASCAVCRTDLHIVDGELSRPKLPLVPGHEIVGRIELTGANVRHMEAGERIGIPWLGWTCGECRFCKTGRENLCDRALFTGYTLDGGYAQFAVADARFCFRIPDAYDDAQAAPLLCAGLIGHRALRKCGDARRIGVYGFGAAGHIVTQVARAEGRDVFAFTRPNDLAGQEFARSLGAVWGGASGDVPPEQLDAALIFAPVGALVPAALRAVAKGGVVVCGGIHMSDIPSFAYADLWEERTVCSVANLTRRDAEEFLAIAARVPIATTTRAFPLERANAALDALRNGQLNGAAVLLP